MIFERARAAGSVSLKAMDVVSGILLIALTLLTVLDVTGRNLLRSPVPGATELTELILAVFVFLTFPRLAYQAGHIVIDLLDPLVSHRMRRMQHAFCGVLGAVAFLGLVWPLVRLSLRAFDGGDATIQLGIPLGYFLMLMAALCGVTAVAFLLGMCSPDVTKANNPERGTE